MFEDHRDGGIYAHFDVWRRMLRHLSRTVDETVNHGRTSTKTGEARRNHGKHRRKSRQIAAGRRFHLGRVFVVARKKRGANSEKNDVVVAVRSGKD